MQTEAGEVVALSQRLQVVYAASEVLDVDTGKGVDLARVATDGKEFRVLEGSQVEVEREEGDAVRVERMTGVPVVWDAFIARLEEGQSMSLVL